MYKLNPVNLMGSYTVSMLLTGEPKYGIDLRHTSYWNKNWAIHMYYVGDLFEYIHMDVFNDNHSCPYLLTMSSLAYVPELMKPKHYTDFTHEM